MPTRDFIYKIMLPPQNYRPIHRDRILLGNLFIATPQPFILIMAIFMFKLQLEVTIVLIKEFFFFLKPSSPKRTLRMSADY